ncbi:MAG: hypothetical protein KKF44_08535 [Nanoarchaeota archaeon]|nr:hypothetical protein [Nanoarchaeota archaeon]
MSEMGKFCEIYDNSIRNRVLEYVLENQDIDFSVPDMARELGISKPKAYEEILEFSEKRVIIKSRIVGKTQLYMLDKNNRLSQIYLRNFNECLRMAIESAENTYDYAVKIEQPAFAVHEKKTRYKKKKN